MVLSPHTHANFLQHNRTNPQSGDVTPTSKQHPVDLQELLVIWILEPTNPPVQNTPGDVEFV